RLRHRVVLTALLAGALLPSPSSSVAACTGDCDRNGVVSVDELLRGVNIALGNAPLSTCNAFDTNGDGTVMINELLSAVSAALNGCPVTPTPTATPGGTGTATKSKTPSPTPTINQPPILTCPGVYRTYTGRPIQFPIAAHDPGGGLHYTA